MTFSNPCCQKISQIISCGPPQTLKERGSYYKEEGHHKEAISRTKSTNDRILENWSEKNYKDHDTLNGITSITTAMIHHAKKDVERQGVDLAPCTEVIHYKCKLP